MKKELRFDGAPEGGPLQETGFQSPAELRRALRRLEFRQLALDLRLFLLQAQYRLINCELFFLQALDALGRRFHARHSASDQTEVKR